MLARALKHTDDLILGTPLFLRVVAPRACNIIMHATAALTSVAPLDIVGHVAQCTRHQLLQLTSVGNGVCIVDPVCDLL